MKKTIIIHEEYQVYDGERMVGILDQQNFWHLQFADPQGRPGLIRPEKWSDGYLEFLD